MYWKRQGEARYLIRTGTDNTQRSLGRESPETIAIMERFQARKQAVESRLKDLETQLDQQRRLNRALFVGRAPKEMLDLLQVLADAEIDEFFTVVGTHALYAYEAAASGRFVSRSVMATQDVGLLFDTRWRMQCLAQMHLQQSSLIGLLKKADPTYELVEGQLYTARNSKGFEIDIIRREAVADAPHPMRATDHEEDFWVTQAKRAGVLLASKPFHAIVVGSDGRMAMVRTIDPVVFVHFKQWLAQQKDREAGKRQRDAVQAETVEAVVRDRLPQWDSFDRPQPDEEP